MGNKEKTKTILVGIDYTKSSENALLYAILLAKKSGASLLLFHVFDMPLIHTNSGPYFVSYSNLENEGDVAKLEKYKTDILSKFPKLKIGVLGSFNSMKQEIKNLYKHHDIDYAVLGLETKTKISKFIYGTTGVDIAGKVECPVIIVPEKYTKHQLSKIAVAIDNKKVLKSKLMAEIDDLSSRFKVKKQFIHIKTEDEFLMIDEKASKKNSEKLNPVTIEALDLKSGITKYTNKNQPDAIVLISRSHSAWYNLFNESNTKQIAFSSKIPVISIHE